MKAYSRARCFYFNNIDDFLLSSKEEICGFLQKGHGGDFASLTYTQTRAWEEEVVILKSFLGKYRGRGHIGMEFSIPRMGRYIDVVLIIDGVIFVIEFKAFKEAFMKSDVAQVMEYVYDLHNFHEPSHGKLIVPILMATQGAEHPNLFETLEQNGRIYNVLEANANNLGRIVERMLQSIPPESPLDGEKWMTGRYFPTPDIIEVSKLLYSGHDVEEISRNDAAAESLANTTEKVIEIVDRSKRNGEKSICFVTGVPGAGKTLVGLNLASKELADKSRLAVYLTGNFPLCAVLQEALARDAVMRSKLSGEATDRLTLTKARSEVKRSIQMVHHYRDEGIRTMNAVGSEGILAEHVTIFDEAQRAWNKDQLRNFMARKKGIDDFEVSEAEFLMSCVNRHNDWGVVVCLVGGGQDINTGEAGIREWFNALLKDDFDHWHIYVSDKLEGEEYESGDAYARLSERDNFHTTPELHLRVSNRSFRAENLAEFVQCLLQRDVEGARATLESLRKYPIVVTRDLSKAKQWLREQSRREGGRYGIVASSGGERLRPDAITVRLKADVVHWFLDGDDDVRSSLFMEDVATEFDIQGLELDWVCLAWDADFRFVDGEWEYKQFSGGCKWQNVRSEDRRRYRLNAYRVLLTRARRGMVIYVPQGDASDPTRLPELYDGTYEYLRGLGLAEM